MQENMEKVLGQSGSLDGKVALTLTRRDILLLELCLQLMYREHTRGGTLRSDIQNLRDKLSRESGKGR